MSHNVKNPPLLSASTSYESWEKSLSLWQLVTDLKPEQQGPALVLSLSGKAKEAAIELSIDEIKSAIGVNLILDKVGQIYKKDTVDTAYEAFESFIKFEREPSMDIPSYIGEFERRYNKAKKNDCTLSTNIQAYFLLNQAKLSADHKKLVRATVSTLEFQEMKTKLLKVFGTSAGTMKTGDEDFSVKVENLNIADDEEEDVLYGRFLPGRQDQ